MKSSSLAAPKSDEGGSSSSHSIWGTHTLSRSAFDVRCSMFDVRCSMFDVRRSVFLKPLLVLIFFTLPSAFGQGSLTPPGPPGATMLTLSQVEPRTPISSAPYVITQPGSYYLTTNVTVTGANAITIATNNVMLDLNGFTISSTAATATGYGIVFSNSFRNITIANGFIQGGVTNNGSGVYSGSGFDYGIFFSANAPVNVLISRVSVSGCLIGGIYLSTGDSTVVESCTTRTVGNFGIVASTIIHSMAVDIGADAIYGDQVSDCRGQSTGSATGIYAYSAQNCYGSSINNYGVDAISALNCTGISSTSDGIVAAAAQNCYGSSNGSGYGVYASYSANGCVGFSNSGEGVYAYAIANDCYGYSSSGTGLYAFIANVCHGETSIGTTLVTSHNVNSY